MRTSLTLTPQEFFAKDQQVARFQSLIAGCMQRQGELVLELTAGTIELRIGNALNRGASLRITGQRSLPDLDLGGIDHVGAKVLLPFFFDIDTLCLNHRQLFYLGRKYRSIADFFARNLFFAAVRNVPFDIQESPTPQLPESAKPFKHEYFFIVKHTLSEPSFDTCGAKEAIDLIALNAYLGTQYFSRPILNQNLGNAHLGRQNDNAAELQATFTMRLLQARTALFAPA